MKKIFVLGDSISIHYGPFLEEMIKGKFAYARKSGEEQALKNLDIPQGANGGDSRMCLEFLKGLRGSGGLDADLLLLNCGLHDVKASFPDENKLKERRQLQVSIEDYQSNLEDIVQVADELKVKLIWVRTTPVDEAQHNTAGSGIFRYSEDVDTYNSAADKIMATRNVSAIDLNGFTNSLGAATELLYDGRHFNEPVRRLQAAYISGWLDNFKF